MSPTLKEQFALTKPGDVGIFGDPVEHSLSPLIQNAAFKTWWAAFRDRDEHTPTYHKFHVPAAQLKEAINLLKEHRLRGVNVTVPHKIDVKAFMDEMDPISSRLGAVNTISFSGEKLSGYNTDAEGFKRALMWDLDYEPEGHTALVLGAGGTGHVIVNTLLDLLTKTVWVWNRNPSRLDKLFPPSREDKGKVKVIHSSADLHQAMEEANLIINATSVGLSPTDGLPIPELQFSARHTVFDVIYHRETVFLQQAKKVGAKAVGGLGMLVYQGARSFEIWTGAPAPIEIMKSVLSEKLQGV